MTSEWPTVRLADCGSWYSGGTPSKAIADYWVGTIPWVSPKDMDQRFVFDAIDHISPQGAEAGSRLIPANSILFVVRSMTLANRFQIAITRREVAFNQDLKAIVCNPDVDPDYLFYSISAQADHILHTLVDEASHGTKRLKTEAIGDLQILLPTLEAQREVASVFSALDDKIELNRRMNATLEETARALFKSWFVDFDPVRAKMEGRQPDGLDAETAALFPDRLVESELGLIPEGWDVRPLDEIADFLNGLALQKYPAVGDEYLPVLKIRELRQGCFDATSDKASPNIGANYVIRDGDVVFSWSGSLMVDVWAGGGGALNQHLFKVSSTSYPKWFYYLWTKYHLADFQRIAEGKATTMGHIQRHHLSSAMTLVPPEPLLKQMSCIMEPLFDEQLRCSLNSGTLTATRDALLPRLLSGEVRVGDLSGYVAEEEC